MPTPPPEITPAAPPPPTSAASSAKPISPAELARELGGAKAPPMAATPPPAPAESGAEVRGSPSLPSLRDKMRETMEKKEAAPKTEDAPPPKAEVKPKPKPAVSMDDAPPPKKPDPSAPVEELSPEERGVLPHDSERVRKRINYFLAEDKKKEAAIAQVRKELEEAKKLPQTAANVEETAKLREEHQKLQEEATRLRRRYDLDNDSEFSAKYRAPVKAAESSIEETFKKNGYGEPTIKAIKDAGGFAAFSRSNVTFPIEVVDPDTQEKKVVNYTAAELARSWVGRMPIADAELIRQSVGRQELLQNEEKAAIQKAQDEAKGYYENQTKAQREAQEASEATTKKLSDEYAAWSQKTETETDWLKDRPVPEGASDEERASIEEYNLTQKELRDGLKKHPTTALEYGQLKLDAAESKHLKRTLKEQETRIAELEAQVKKGKAAMKTTPKSGSLLTGGGKEPADKAPSAEPTNFLAGLRKKVLEGQGSADE